MLAGITDLRPRENYALIEITAILAVNYPIDASQQLVGDLVMFKLIKVINLTYILSNSKKII